MENETAFTNSQGKKLSLHENDVSFDDSFSYCILQFTNVFSAISEYVVWKNCGEKVKFLKGNVRGIGFRLDVYCRKCNENIQNVYSSRLANGYEINRRFVFAMRLLQRLGCKIGTNLHIYCEKEDANKLKHARIATVQATYQKDSCRYLLLAR